MDTHKTTNQGKPRYENHINSHKKFNKNELNCTDVIRASVWLMPAVSPAAYNLSRYLATWWNSRIADGIVYPSESRIANSLGLKGKALHEAADELASVGWWKPKYQNNRIVNYLPLFKPLFTDEKTPHAKYRMSVIRGVRSSLNHTKVDARYFPVDNQLARSLTAFAVDRIKPKYNDLGYADLLRDGQREAISHQFSHGKKVKIVHSVMFDHEIFCALNLQAWKALARTKRVPLDWTKNSYSTTFTVGDFKKHINVSDPAEFTDAITAITDSGWWKVKVVGDPFADSEFEDETTFTLTPQHPFHQLVWELDMLGGGEQIGKWETEHGFNDSRFQKDRGYPPLGYHAIYALRSVMTGKILYVGQTTQPLEYRLHQHMRNGTNAEASKAINWVVNNSIDSLEILQLATVHRSIVAEEEMVWANLLLEIGHPIQNKILTVAENVHAIKEDSRFGFFADQSIQENIDALRVELEGCLVRNGGMTALWQIDAVPEIPDTRD